MTAITLSGNNTIFNRLTANAAVTVQLDSNQPGIPIPADGDIRVGASHWVVTNIAGGLNPGNWAVEASVQLAAGWMATIQDGPIIIVEDNNHGPGHTLILVPA